MFADSKRKSAHSSETKNTLKVSRHLTQILSLRRIQKMMADSNSCSIQSLIIA